MYTSTQLTFLQTLWVDIEKSIIFLYDKIVLGQGTISLLFYKILVKVLPLLNINKNYTNTLTFFNFLAWLKTNPKIIEVYNFINSYMENQSPAASF